MKAIARIERSADLLLAVQDNYSAHIRHFVGWLGDRPLEMGTVREYLVDLNASDYAASTKRVRRQAIKRRLKQLSLTWPVTEQAKLREFLQQLDEDPATAAHKTNGDAIGERACLSLSEYTELCRGAGSERQRRFLELLFATGIRINEATGIKLADCDAQDTVKIRIRGKGRKERFVFVDSDLFADLRATFRGSTYLLETQGGKRYRNGYISDEIRRLGRKVLGRRISAHTLRHTFATLAVADGWDISALSKYLGHSSPSITLALYVHTSAKTADIASKLRQARAYRDAA